MPALEALSRSPHSLELVATRVPRPSGRGGKLTATPVAVAARRLGLPLAEVQTVKAGSGFEALTAAKPELLVVVAYGEILPRAVLDVPSVAPVNLHFSLLPLLRGAAPVQRAILEGLPVTGVTTMRMDEGMDTGPILLQRAEAIRPDDDSGSLGARLASLGGELLVDTASALENGRLEELAQDHDRATYAPKLTAQDRLIDWSATAEDVARLVRAMAPDPGAATSFRGRRLKILRATVEETGTDGPGAGGASAGLVVTAAKDRLTVAAGAGIVGLERVAPEGSRAMTGGEFVRGYRPRPGERLGEGAMASGP